MSGRPARKLRCAVYPRKSSEEDLEQEFNSLHAQREAALAYIASQKSEGWIALPDHYDDGGISGGTLERPALKRLLRDVEAKLIDVVVVYKIDRLSRSLTDFAKLVDVFERHNVTFVSVTQQFNTTTSMGRLTLNILLSFAQFEREVIGERIRDKFAASRRKGMWMGGWPPLGYDVQDRRLVVVEREAAIVRRIFDRFIHDACVRVGLDPLLMAPPAAFGLADHEPALAVDLPAEVAPATDDATVAPQAEPPAPFGLADEDPEVALDPSAEDEPATDDVAVVSEAEQQDDAADPGSEDLQDAGDEPPTAFGLANEDSEVTPATDEAAVAQAKQGDDGADLDAEGNLQDAGDDVPEATDQEAGSAATRAYCHNDFGPDEPRHVINGRLYHGDPHCLDWGRRTAIAAE